MSNSPSDGYIDPPHAILRALDSMAWADRLGIKRDLHPDEVLLVLHTATGEWGARRVESVAARMRVVELVAYCHTRLGVRKSALARATGLEPQEITRILARHETAR